MKKSEWIADICHNVRLVHITICTIHDNAIRIKESAKCLDNIKCQQSETGTVCVCSKTTTVLSQWIVPKTMDMNHLYFYSLEINKYILWKRAHSVYSTYIL